MTFTQAITGIAAMKGFRLTADPEPQQRRHRQQSTRRNLRARFERACERCDEIYARWMKYEPPTTGGRFDMHERAMRNATRLWNLADHEDESEDLWDILMTYCSWAFDEDGNANSIRFTY